MHFPCQQARHVQSCMFKDVLTANEQAGCATLTQAVSSDCLKVACRGATDMKKLAERSVITYRQLPSWSQHALGRVQCFSTPNCLLALWLQPISVCCLSLCLQRPLTRPI